MKKELERMFIHSFESPMGWLFLFADERALKRIEFSEIPLNKQTLDELNQKFYAELILDSNPILEQTKIELKQYFDGILREFTVPLSPIGTDFQKRVWDELRQIPYGTTTTYLKESQKLGDIKAIRAVATANGANPIAILIPCHRVIGKDGSLTGYRGGLERKK